MRKINFRTELETAQSDFKINHQQPLLLAGSCFAENIGKKLTQSKFNAIVNPLGIAYNPLSLHKLLRCNSAEVNQANIQTKTEQAFHFDFHSEFNTSSQELFLNQLHPQIEVKNEAMKAAEILLISYGTAWIYERIENKEVVNNCHKLPAERFTKRLLSVDEIFESWESMVEELTTSASNIKQIIFTVSPIRHLKDGFRENQLSKSTLHLAVNKICQAYEHCDYFPSYELLIDDLRDYRFYEKDLVHPNSIAIDYIWQKFSDSYFSAETVKNNMTIEKFNNSLSHRPFHSQSEAHQQFLRQLKTKLEDFQTKSSISFEKELQNLEKELLS